MNIKHKNLIYGTIIVLSAFIIGTILFKITNTTPFDESYSIIYENGVKTETHYSNKKQSTQYIAKEGVITGIQSSNVVVKSGTSLTVSGIVSGNIKVENGASANISGSVNGDIDVENGAHTNISGSINGNVINAGKTDIYGMINGDVIKRSGTLYIAPNAMIQGNVQ